MDSAKKKALKDAYKATPETGAVYCIRCSGNNRVWILSTRNIDGIKNRFNFAMSIKGCPDPTMRSECEKYGSESFSMEVLEEIKKGDTQTDKEFAADVDLLCEMWREKLNQGEVK